MHPSSILNMRICAATYADASFYASRPRVCILELGSADVNGTYRPLFSAPNVEYTGADLAPGPGVEIVLDDAYHLPVADGSMDLVISGQMFEHCEFFWLAFREMMRVLKPDGFLFLIAPSSGYIHRFPVDCYRFYPDAYHALAKDSGGHLVDVWLDERGPWCDLTGVFSKQPFPTRPRVVGSMAPEDIAMTRPPEYPASLEIEHVSTGVGYLEFLARAHALLAPQLYLEIGVRNGASLALARGPAIGVDPLPAISVELRSDTKLIAETSDAFFADGAAQSLTAGVDLAFIDGMHLAEFVLRDYINVERYAHPWSLVVFDDVFPLHEAQARRRRESRVWTGDVWRALAALRRHRPDLLFLSLDTSPTGLTLVAGLKPGHRGLIQSFNPVLSELRSENDVPPPAAVLKREGAVAAYDTRVGDLLALLSSLRSAGASADSASRELARWRDRVGL